MHVRCFKFIGTVLPLFADRGEEHREHAVEHDDEEH
jgi:hypothetical protein